MTIIQAVPALVSEELFAAVAEQLGENRRRQRQRRRGARYLPQGLLACQCCGYAYYGKQVSLWEGREATPAPTRPRWHRTRARGTQPPGSDPETLPADSPAVLPQYPRN